MANEIFEIFEITDEMIAAFESGVDVHRRTASLIFGVGNDEVTPEMRRIVKTINFGEMYGMVPEGDYMDEPREEKWK